MSSADPAGYGLYLITFKPRAGPAVPGGNRRVAERLLPTFLGFQTSMKQHLHEIPTTNVPKYFRCLFIVGISDGSSEWF